MSPNLRVTEHPFLSLAMHPLPTVHSDPKHTFVPPTVNLHSRRQGTKIRNPILSMAMIRKATVCYVGRLHEVDATVKTGVINIKHQQDKRNVPAANQEAPRRRRKANIHLNPLRCL